MGLGRHYSASDMFSPAFPRVRASNNISAKTVALLWDSSVITHWLNLHKLRYITNTSYIKTVIVNETIFGI